MENFALVAKYFALSLPFFLVSVLAEKLYGYIKGSDTVPFIDAISSGYSGITMMMKQLLGLSVTIVSYSYLVNHVALYSTEAAWVNYVIAFVALDFSFYWGHRISHRVNYFWNVHLIHHSSEEFNLACALRQSISDFIHAFTIFLLPAALLGVPAKLIAVIAPLHSLAQYWYHTRQIGKLGWLEYIIVTPSQHRVHHAMNPIYLDKNYSAIFCIWDRIFGTFQEELDTEPPVYGITRPARTYNPITINFQHLILMIKDAWRTISWLDKFTIWFKPTGWRPADVKEKYPVYSIADVRAYNKFTAAVTPQLLAWSMTQFFVLLFLFFYVLLHADLLSINELFLFGLFVFVQVYSATELMNQNKNAIWFSVATSVVCLVISFYDTTFFNVNRLSGILPYLLVLYFVCQPIVALIFSAKVMESSIATNEQVI